MSFTIPAASFRDMLTGTLVAVARESVAPVLNGIEVSWEGHTVTVAATDRYRLAIGEYATGMNGDGDIVTGAGSFVISADMAKALSKSLPTAPARGGVGHEKVTVSLEDGIITAMHGNGTMTGHLHDKGEFPKWRNLVPSADKYADLTGTIAFNPKYLADVDKIPHGKSDPVRWNFTGNARQAIASYAPHNGVQWTYILCPVRLP